MRTTFKDDEKEEYTSFLKNVKADREESSNFAKSLLGFVICICSAFVIMYLLFLDDNSVKITNKNSETKRTSSHSKLFHKRSSKSFSLPTFSRSKNILLLGVDSNGENTDKWEATRTDTIILVNVDPKNRSLSAISIPRDSKVYIGDKGAGKINSAHVFGGIKLVKQTIEDSLGVRIDNYIMVHDDAVKEMVDALDGVSIFVEKNMNYDDYTGKLHIHLTKGVNTLDGTQAVGYLRFRHDGLGDIGRTRRQQWFLKGLLDEMKSPKTIGKLPELLNVARANIKTDMSVYELSQLANSARALSDGGVQIATLPGAPNQSGSVSYWILDPEKVQDVVNRFIYHENEQIESNSSLVAGIMYTPTCYDEAEEVKTQLTELGLKVNLVELEGLPHSQFVAHNKNVSNGLFNYITKRIPALDNMQFVYDPLKNYCANSDFTIILAN